MEECNKKICSKCKKEKELEGFSKNSNYKNGYEYNCKQCRKEYATNYVLNNKERIKNHKKKSIIKNIQKIKKYQKEYGVKHKDKKNEYDRLYRKNNKEKINLQQKNKKDEDPLYKLKCNLRSNIRSTFNKKNHKKNSRTHEILGCSYEEFKQYIESQWQEWMNWENHGLYNKTPNYGWDLDHIIPVSSAKTEDELIKLNHYTNFQPLCSYINREIKRNKVIH